MQTPRTSVFTNVWVMGRLCQVLNLGTYPGVRNTNALVLHIITDALAAILDSLEVQLWSIGIWESSNLLKFATCTGTVEQLMRHPFGSRICVVRLEAAFSYLTPHIC